ncbi:2OG-Fe(II) oxygenase [Rheinheimera metallidurans]|uniref:2OG-Fe(II) oxygenase n=1 Tax=Rheinheimera metallidurans TaxID=2925781 RepID=UPI003001C61D
MWLNKEKTTNAAIRSYRQALLHANPNFVVIDHLFNDTELNNVISTLLLDNNWHTQKHSYSALYVDNAKWQKTSKKQRFVQRDIWQRTVPSSDNTSAAIALNNSASEFLAYLRSAEFIALLSKIFKVYLTDINVANPAINTNYFRLAAPDFVNLHADDSPGREVCMLLYLNKHWHSNLENNGGELVFKGTNNCPIKIAPLYNRCVLFDPSSAGAEHWVNAMTTENTQKYRYNVTSWYWSL